jgi:3-oxoacyl-[acyl-carrier-protein] synthase III
MGTDGRGQRHAIIPAGGFRSPRSAETAQFREFEGGNFRTDEHLSMNGAGVLAFAMQHVPKLVRETLAAAGWSMDDMDALVMHQANRAILEFLVKRLGLQREKVVFAMEDFGNTSSASVPLAMTHALRERLSSPARIVLASFGNGFSWGAAAAHTDNVCMPPLIRVPSPEPLVAR